MHHNRRSFSDIMPTLLTSSSMPWSMTHDRYLLPIEAMYVMGLQVHEDGWRVRSGFEVLAEREELHNKQQTKEEELRE